MAAIGELDPAPILGVVQPHLDSTVRACPKRMRSATIVVLVTALLLPIAARISQASFSSLIVLTAFYLQLRV